MSRILRVPLHIALYERAERDNLKGIGSRVLERRAHQSRACSAAPNLGGDLGVDENQGAASLFIV